HQLVMPQALAAARIKRDERIAEEVIARAIAAVEIEARAPEVDERNALPLVDRELAPVVDAAGCFVSVGRPRVVPELAGVRDAVEDPLNSAGAHVIRLHVGGSRVVARTLGRQ